VTLTEVMAALGALGTEQNRKVYRRHGAGENQFGVSFANLNKLQKRIKTDQELAEALWQTGNADARCLALMIADARAMTAQDLDRWLDDIEEARYYTLADLLVRHVAGKSSHARAKAEQWIAAGEREYTGQAGWDLLAVLAMQDEELPDAYFEPYLGMVRSQVHASKNRVRHAMNNALIAIGLRNQALRSCASEVAAEIGKVRVDHGQTGCKTPDARAYIDRAWARRRSA
jgi:3-methyladenine DNA glycosylase AlkD